MSRAPESLDVVSRLVDEANVLRLLRFEIAGLPDVELERILFEAKCARIRITRPDKANAQAVIERFEEWLGDVLDGRKPEFIHMFNDLTERQCDLYEKAWSILQMVHEEFTEAEARFLPQGDKQ